MTLIFLQYFVGNFNIISKKCPLIKAKKHKEPSLVIIMLHPCADLVIFYNINLDFKLQFLIFNSENK